MRPAHRTIDWPKIVGYPEQDALVTRIAVLEVLCFRRRTTCQLQGIDLMKTTTVLAIALGVGALAACNNTPAEQAADNIEANAEATADMIEENADAGTDAMEANADATADAVRAEGEATADTVREGADADGNSAN